MTECAIASFECTTLKHAKVWFLSVFFWSHDVFVDQGHPSCPASSTSRALWSVEPCVRLYTAVIMPFMSDYIS